MDRTPWWGRLGAVEDLQHYAVRTIRVAQRIHRDTLPSHYHRLPTLTTILARPAKMLGVFGLVPYRFTYPYRIRVCDAGVNQVGLDPAAGGLPLLTICYHTSDLV